MRNALSTVEGYELVGLIILTVLALIPFLLTILALLDWVKVRLTRSRPRRRLRQLALAADLVLVMGLVDGFLVEPNLLTVTRINDTSPQVATSTGEIRIVQVSDFHFEKETPLLRKVLRAVAAEKPDIIVNTGDTCQMGPAADLEQFHQFYAKLTEIAPTYHITGDPSLKESGGHGHSAWDKPRVLYIRGTRVEIFGARWINPSLDPSAPRPSGLRLVIGHMPDYYEDAVRMHPDWYLCGHTHGGQVRIPFWGAVVTNSHTGKRFEYGRYRVGDMNMFVSRGIGFEPRPAPQVRFLCPPEIVLLTIKPEER